MSFSWCESFTGYNKTIMSATVWSNVSGSGSSLITSGGRYSGNCYRHGNNGNGGDARSLINTTATFVNGWAIKLQVSQTVSSTFTLVAWQDTTTNQVELRLNTARNLIISVNNVTLGTSSYVLPNDGNWYYVEVKVLVANSGGTYEVRVNGVNVLSGGSADTQNTGNASVNRVYLFPSGAAAFSGSIDICDMYFADDQGGSPSFIGDLKISCQLPNAAGAATGFTPSTGSNYQNVDDNPANGDTDYNSSLTLNAEDLFDYPTFSVSATVVAVQVSTYLRKDDTTSPTVRNRIRSGSTTYDHGGDFIPNASYGYNRTLLTLDPDTGVAFTAGAIDAKQFGYKLTAL